MHSCTADGCLGYFFLDKMLKNPVIKGILMSVHFRTEFLHFSDLIMKRQIIYISIVKIAVDSGICITPTVHFIRRQTSP